MCYACRLCNECWLLCWGMPSGELQLFCRIGLGSCACAGRVHDLVCLSYVPLGGPHVFRALFPVYHQNRAGNGAAMRVFPLSIFVALHPSFHLVGAFHSTRSSALVPCLSHHVERYIQVVMLVSVLLPLCSTGISWKDYSQWCWSPVC